MALGDPTPDRIDAGNGIFTWLLLEQGFPHRLPYAPDLMVTIGALAGFTIPIMIWTAFDRLPAEIRSLSLLRVDTETGEAFYFGDMPNRLLAEGTRERPSIWNYLTDGVGDQRPDLDPLFEVVASRLGRADLWRAPIEGRYAPKITPLDALDRHWRPLRDYLEQSGRDLMDWRLDLAYAAGRVIASACDQRTAGDHSLPPPQVAVQLAMWSAIVASKLNPGSVRGVTAPAGDHSHATPLARRQRTHSPIGKVPEECEGEFFSAFHLLPAREPFTTSDRTVRHYFRPSGEAFRALVSVELLGARDQEILEARLSLDRAFVDDVRNGAFARDIAGRFLSWALRNEPSERIRPLIENIAASATARPRGSVPTISKPDPTGAYAVYLGRSEGVEDLTLRNIAGHGGKRWLHVDVRPFRQE